MLVVTNRNVVATGKISDETAFGEKVNANGPNEIRLAHAEKNGKKWVVEIVPEPAKITAANAPSRKAFFELTKRCQATGRQVMFFVHGFNKSFPESLEQGHTIETRYNVEVVLFSWPASPGGFVTEEYRRSRQVAQASFGAFDRMLEKFGGYILEQKFDKHALVSCEITVNLMAYSMGAYLFQNYVTSNAYAQETRIFDNVVLCQADVDNAEHRLWVEKVASGLRTYVTINERDKVLGFSERINPPRLGRELVSLNAANAIYVDVTGGKDVGNEHQIWGDDMKNDAVKNFFTAALRGERGELVTGFHYDQRVNAFRLGS